MFITIQTARTTTLNVTELCNLLQHSPEHIFVNELGVIFVKDSCPIAESALIEILKKEHGEICFVAYCQLLRANSLSKRANQTLKLFVANRVNKPIVDKAKKYLWLNFN